jgi:hypothetical protein
LAFWNEEMETLFSPLQSFTAKNFIANLTASKCRKITVFGKKNFAMDDELTALNHHYK